MSAETAAERFRKIKDLLQQALELAPEKRAGFIAQRCGDDAGMRDEALALLEACDDARDFLETPPTLDDDGGVAPIRAVLNAGVWVGPYQLEECLGEGGMGVVYRALDPRLGRSVALKFLSAAVAHDDAACARLYREARATSALTHPNIRPIYDICDYAGHTFMVMEYLEGQALSQATRSKVSIHDLLSTAIQICDALDFAHSRGILHRDIKPANVFRVNRGDHIKLLDFGIAKVLEGRGSSNDSLIAVSQTNSAIIVGTAAYMSPEQARGERLDRRTDLFSLGTLLYELATEKNPFHGATTALVYDAILNTTPAPVSHLRPDLPAALDRIVARLLEKDREKRYQSAAAAASDLRMLKRELDSREYAAMKGDPVKETPWRGRWLAAVAAILLLIAIAACAAWWVAGNTLIRGDTSQTGMRETALGKAQ